MKPTRYQLRQLASNLMHLGLRPPIVGSVTLQSPTVLRSLYAELFGRPAKAGVLPQLSSLIETRRKRLGISVLLNIYIQVAGRGRRKTEWRDVVTAHLTYLTVVPDEMHLFDANDAYQIAKYLDSRLVELRRCQGCGNRYVICPEALRRPMFTCPFCSPMDRRGLDRRRKRKNGSGHESIC